MDLHSILFGNPAAYCKANKKYLVYIIYFMVVGTMSQEGQITWSQKVPLEDICPESMDFAFQIFIISSVYDNYMVAI